MRSIVLRGASRPLLAAFGISCLFVAACTAQAGAPEDTVERRRVEHDCRTPRRARTCKSSANVN